MDSLEHLPIDLNLVGLHDFTVLFLKNQAASEKIKKALQNFVWVSLLFRLALRRERARMGQRGTNNLRLG